MQLNAQFHDLKDSHVFITGGGSGIGAAFTEAFLMQGAKVSFIQRSEVQDFCHEMGIKYGIQPSFIPCDITDIGALQAAISQATDTYGPIATLINNAASDNRHQLDDFSVADWDQAMHVNLRPHFFTAQAIAPQMRNLGGGSIINLSSISYIMGNAGYPAYVASKAAITGLTRALARELGPDKIRVNALLPGWVMTQRQKDLWVTPEGLEQHLDRQCIKDTLVSEDIVGAALFLASHSSRMLTGQAIAVDGGVVVTG